MSANDTNPVRPAHEPGYPTRREFLETAGKLGLAALGLAFVARPSTAQEVGRLEGDIAVPSVPVRTAGVPPPPPPGGNNEKDPADSASPETRKEVAALSRKLGDRDSKVRASAVKALIAIGTVCEEKDGQKTWPNKACVLAEMEKCRNDADPEIAERAGEVIAAIQQATSPVKPPELVEEGEIQLGGVIAVPDNFRQ